jgi:predicted nucleic acid-binding protein
VILDTNALSAFVGGDAGVGDVLRSQPRACIPVMALGEFRYGITPLEAHRLPVLSRDRHFDAVPRLERQDW